MIVYNLSPEFEYNITIFLYTLDLVKIFLIETYIKEFEASTQEYKKNYGCILYSNYASKVFYQHHNIQLVVQNAQV
jgi:hypothetical protein